MSSYSSNSTPSSGGSSPTSPRPSTAPSSPGAPNPLLPPPPHPLCDDAGHCHATGRPQCGVARLRVCPGLTNGPGTLFGNLQHPHPHQVMTCEHCRDHDGNADWGIMDFKIHSPAVAGRPQAMSGTQSQMCHACIRDEMELYWERQGTPNPNVPGSSTRLVEQWPTAPGQDQRLCICIQNAIQAYENHCHACRDEGFRRRCYRPWGSTQRILETRNRAVITGKKRCVLNGGTAQHAVAPVGMFGRTTIRCPCGNKPKDRQWMSEYAEICIACMGVKITVANLPAKYQQANMPPRRRSPRNHPTSKTKGPRRADRSARFRVNIERAWQHNDLLVGGY